MADSKKHEAVVAELPPDLPKENVGDGDPLSNMPSVKVADGDTPAPDPRHAGPEKLGPSCPQRPERRSQGGSRSRTGAAGLGDRQPGSLGRRRRLEGRPQGLGRCSRPGRRARARARQAAGEGGREGRADGQGHPLSGTRPGTGSRPSSLHEAEGGPCRDSAGARGKASASPCRTASLRPGRGSMTALEARVVQEATLELQALKAVPCAEHESYAADCPNCLTGIEAHERGIGRKGERRFLSTKGKGLRLWR
jgi:hypothetical protein